MENTHDSIRDGDAIRLMDCTKFSLMLFRKFRKDKYAYTLLLFLFYLKVKLTIFSGIDSLMEKEGRVKTFLLI